MGLGIFFKKVYRKLFTDGFEAPYGGYKSYQEWHEMEENKRIAAQIRAGGYSR